MWEKNVKRILDKRITSRLSAIKWIGNSRDVCVSYIEIWWVYILYNILYTFDKVRSDHRAVRIKLTFNWSWSLFPNSELVNVKIIIYYKTSCLVKRRTFVYVLNQWTLNMIVVYDKTENCVHSTLYTEDCTVDCTLRDKVTSKYISKSQSSLGPSPDTIFPFQKKWWEQWLGLLA